MALHWFNPPVVVQSEGSGQTSYGVTNVERAAEFLLRWRHLNHGPSWLAAVEACMDAIKNGGCPDEARKKFEAAARECGQLV